VFQARGGVPNPARRSVDGEVVERRLWLGWLAGARCECVQAGTWNPGPQHGRDVAAARVDEGDGKVPTNNAMGRGFLRPSTVGSSAPRTSRRQQQGGAGERRLAGVGHGKVVGRCR
jgi:hypothetical protein